jgi:hypothetical protein
MSETRTGRTMSGWKWARQLVSELEPALLGGLLGLKMVSVWVRVLLGSMTELKSKGWLLD